MRTAARKDANHSVIVNHARSLGFYAWETYQLHECCDVVLIREGHVFFCEIKDGEKPPSQRKMTPGEIKFKQEIDKHKGVHVVVEKESDINDLFLKTL